MNEWIDVDLMTNFTKVEYLWFSNFMNGIDSDWGSPAEQQRCAETEMNQCSLKELQEEILRKEVFSLDASWRAED